MVRCLRHLGGDGFIGDVISRNGTDNVYVCVALVFAVRLCRVLCIELRNKERISVAAASKLLANTVYYYRGMGLSMGYVSGGSSCRRRIVSVPRHCVRTMRAC